MSYAALLNTSFRLAWCTSSIAFSTTWNPVQLTLILAHSIKSITVFSNHDRTSLCDVVCATEAVHGQCCSFIWWCTNWVYFKSTYTTHCVVCYHACPLRKHTNYSHLPDGELVKRSRLTDSQKNHWEEAWLAGACLHACLPNNGVALQYLSNPYKLSVNQLMVLRLAHWLSRNSCNMQLYLFPSLTKLYIPLLLASLFSSCCMYDSNNLHVARCSHPLRCPTYSTLLMITILPYFQLATSNLATLMSFLVHLAWCLLSLLLQPIYLLASPTSHIFY